MEAITYSTSNGRRNSSGPQCVDFQEIQSATHVLSKSGSCNVVNDVHARLTAVDSHVKANPSDRRSLETALSVLLLDKIITITK